MSWWIWVTLAAAAGIAVGYFIGRSSRAGVKRSLQLDQELREMREEFERYRNGVVEHFTTTAQLVNKLTADYRAVYQHLSRGAQELAGGRIPQLEALTPPAAERIAPPPAVDELLGELEDHGVGREEADLRSQRRPITAHAEGWYEDVAPGTEVPDYAREERNRKTGS